MKIIHTVTCNNCKTENASFELICKNCRSYLRERIVNIDLWNMIALIIESPIQGFTKIINAEHKNFIFFLLFLISLKSVLNVIFISLISINNPYAYYNFFLNYLIITVTILVTLLTFSFVIKKISLQFSLVTRFKDILAISIYSLLPYALSVVVIFPIELILFGGDIFSVNPSPIQLKPTIAYMLITIEVLVICWSIFLSVSAFYSQSKNIYYGLVVGLTLNLILFVEFYAASIHLFNF